MSTTGLKMSLFATVMLSCMHKEPTPVVEDPAVPVEYATTPACLPDWPCQGDLLALIRKTKVSFESNRATLTSLSRSGLELVAQLLRRYPATRIVIAGNCDERGTNEYNLHLGQKLAEIAKKYLVVMGVDPERIATISYGFHKRVGEPQNADARTTSRSDDFSVKGVGVAAALNP